MLIAGLHSNWITDTMVGMQRPSARAIREHNILEQLKKLGITTIVNCTMAGEHPYCGQVEHRPLQGFAPLPLRQLGADFNASPAMASSSGQVSRTIPRTSSRRASSTTSSGGRT
jgi:hypothetical protein